MDEDKGEGRWVRGIYAEKVRDPETTTQSTFNETMFWYEVDPWLQNCGLLFSPPPEFW